ncbi:MAG: ATPase [Bacteroidales bacterium]|nr:ATPase [Bacteroidales bacterium]
MDNPFVFNGAVDTQYFAGRIEEISHLTANFTFLTNTLIASPQGWGKSSLVKKAAEAAVFREPKLRIARMDLFNIRSEEQFYIFLAQAVIQAISSTIDEAVGYVSRYLGTISPKIGIGAGKASELTLDFSWSDIRKNKDNILRLPTSVAEELGIKIIICIDNFHNAEWFDNIDEFIARLEESMMQQNNVAYCICGNDSRIMDRMANSFRPISVYGERMEIGKINSKDLLSFICDRFAESSKYIDNETARCIIDCVEGHPSYVQQLAHLSWLRTSVVCTKEIVLNAHAVMVDQMSLLFKTLTSTLTNQQLCYMNALLSGEKIISTSDILHKYRITSATSASRSKTALLEKDILTIGRDGIRFTDPLYAFWLRHKYFSNSI